MYQRKTYDEWIVQGYYGFGWEDECVEFTRKEGLQRLKEYRANSQYASRLVKRRIQVLGEGVSVSHAKDGE